MQFKLATFAIWTTILAYDNKQTLNKYTAVKTGFQNSTAHLAIYRTDLNWQVIM